MAIYFWRVKNQLSSRLIDTHRLDTFEKELKTLIFVDWSHLVRGWEGVS